jgi:cysteine desulfurase
MKAYLDNAATTAIDPEVIDAMIPVLREKYGNPSSIHHFGREARTILEESRKKIAGYLNVSPAEIFFTSGGTEANNMAIRCTVHDMQIKDVISSRIEHHAVLHTLEELQKEGEINLHFVNLDEKGNVDLNHLEKLLKSCGRGLVSLMHANNEIGTLLPVKKVGELCENYNALFHSDTVQTMGHYKIDLQNIKVHFVTCSAHKFHGPKGIGFIYINSNVKIHPLIYGGAQERNMRGGTENIYGIAGLAKAMEIAYRDLEKDQKYIREMKSYMIKKFQDEMPGIYFNGPVDENSLYTVLNVCLPSTDIAEMLLFSMDISGIAASGGSACSSGSDMGSHVLKAINADPERPSVRFSFSKYNTIEEIDFCVEKIKELYTVKV